jgi:hypothetical protein
MRFRLLVVVLLVGVGVADARDIRRRIVLRPGQAEASVAGRVPRPDDVVVYDVAAPVGARVFVRLRPGARLVAQLLLVPGAGAQIGPGAELDCVVDGSGGFQVRVVPRERSAGSFRLYLRVR